MKKLLGFAVVVALAVVVYAKVIRGGTEERACERLDSLCGGEVDVGECRTEFEKAEKIVGEKVIDKAADCIDDANSCVEAIGCVAGAAEHLVDDFHRGVERGRR